MWARFVPRKQKPADIDNKPTPAVTAGE